MKSGLRNVWWLTMAYNSGFMVMASVWSLDGVRRRPAQHMKAMMLLCNLGSANSTYSYVFGTLKYF